MDVSAAGSIDLEDASDLSDMVQRRLLVGALVVLVDALAGPVVAVAHEVAHVRPLAPLSPAAPDAPVCF